jgi:hypothetical protein
MLLRRRALRGSRCRYRASGGRLLGASLTGPVKRVEILGGTLDKLLDLPFPDESSRVFRDRLDGLVE